MFKKEMALALIGSAIPFCVQADLATSSKSPSLDQGGVIKTNQMPAGYNHSAAYNLADGWDVYLSASFIYWNAQQENMEIGYASNANHTSLKALYAKTEYKPGFKVGIGIDMPGMDDWNLYAEYTWFNHHTHASHSGTILPVLANFLDQGVTSPVAEASSVSAAWKIDLNILDGMLQRPFYEGRKLILNAGFGLRAMWLEQKLDVSYPHYEYADIMLGSGFANGHCDSWALGPRISLDTNWLLGMGFRIVGKAAASVLYTRYTTLNGTSNLNENLITRRVKASDDYNQLRAITETSLGLSWGSYCCDRQFHFDLAASYDFNIYWSQNELYMVHQQDGAPGSLTLQGLNITARFDF